MGFKCGIVGLPNVGKSTLFNALTKAAVAAANYPFCTIEPNVGVVPVPDKRMDKIAEWVRPERIVPTTVNFVDIAGLVKGAASGEGLGNKFLSHIRETQAIAHVVRCFENEDVTHVEGKIDPVSDAETINLELILSDLDSVEKALTKVEKKAKSGDKTSVKEKACFDRLIAHLNANKPVRSFDYQDDVEEEIVRSLHLLTEKPVLYIANVNESGLKDNPHVAALEALALREGASVIPVCASIEAELAQLDEEDKTAFLEDLGLKEPGLNRIIQAGYHLLGLKTYFTAGVKEVRAWTFPIGATAPQAAGIIHSDFERGFIRAEVIAYEDFVQYKGEQGAKEAGKFRLEGKEYLVQDGDVIHFRFNV